MRKQQGRVEWPYEEFNAYLNGLMTQAGIPLSIHGTPNTTVFEEVTGVDAGRVSRWRQGRNQPTVESLRQVANGLGPRLGMEPAALLITLEVKAGRRSEAEAQTSGVAPVELPTVDQLDRRINVLRIAIGRPGIGVEERQELEMELVRIKAMKRMNEEAVTATDEVLKRYGHSALLY